MQNTGHAGRELDEDESPAITDQSAASGLRANRLLPVRYFLMILIAHCQRDHVFYFLFLHNARVLFNALSI